MALDAATRDERHVHHMADARFETGWPDFSNVQVANDKHWKQVYDVRTRAFEERHLPLPQWVREDDDACQGPDGRTYLLLQKGYPVATVQTVLNRPGYCRPMTPTVRAFGREVVEAATSHESFLDVAKLCVCQDFIVPDIRRTCAILQNVTRDMEKTGARWIVTASRQDHHSLYMVPGLERVNAEMIIDDCSGPLALFVMDWHSVRPHVLRDHGLTDCIAPVLNR